MKSSRPAFASFRIGEEVMYGARQLTASALARASSHCSPVEAPLRSRIWNGLPASWSARALRARASGTAFGEPAGVKPLTPTIAPSGIISAASSAVSVG